MKRSLTLGELSKLTESKLIGDPTHIIESVNDLKAAKSKDASFLANTRYKELLISTDAGVVCIDPSVRPKEGKNFLISQNPSQAFQQIALALLGEETRMGFTGIHPSATVHETAQIHPSASIGPFAVIDKDVTIGESTIIYPHVYVGSGTFIGKNCILYPQVTVRENCQIHNRVILQPGVVIGSCGFGYTYDKETGFKKLQQLGNVILEDDVEIGSNACVDRARFKSTTISKGTKIDNIVQIGHNAHIGEHNAIVALSGVAGSSKTGRNVMLGAQSGVVGHVEITDNVTIATRGGVSKSIKEPGNYRGGPVMPYTEYNRQKVHLRKIDKYVKRIEALEKRLDELSNS